MGRKPRKRGGKAKGRGRCLKDWIPVLVGRARGQAFTTDKVLPRMNGNEVAEPLEDVVKLGERFFVPMAIRPSCTLREP
jgi:hypothetical protein